MARLLPVLLLVLAGLLPALARAQTGGGDGVTLVDPRTEWEQISPQLQHFADPSREMDLTQALEHFASGAAEGTRGTPLDYDYVKDNIWATFTLRNETEADVWRLRARENFFQGYGVWLIRPDGTVEVLEDQDETSPFSDRSVPFPELVTGFVLPPGEEAQIVIRYWSGGSTETSFIIFDADAFTLWASTKSAKNFVYYGMMLLLIIGAFVAWVVTGNGVFGSYGLYAIFGLLFIAHADGNTFQHLWPGAPGFNAYASVLLGAGIISAGANFARQFLMTAQYHPRLDKVLIALIVVVLSMVAATLFFDTQAIKKLLVLMSLVGVLTFTIAGLIAARTRFREVRFYVLAWGGAVISSLIMTMRHWIGLDISEELQFDSMRVVFVVDAAMMGLAIIDRVNQMRQQRQTAMELSLSEAQKTVAISARMQELEKRFRMASDLARNRNRALIDTVHDLRQPLMALRLNVHNMIESGGQGADHARIEETFAYLEDLVSKELDRQAAPEEERPAPTPPAEVEPLDLGDMLRTVAEMFASDAAAKGLRLSHVPTSARVRLPPMAVMRMLSNLVANAVKFTREGRVLIGVRHVDGGLRIEVHDTGPGIPLGDFAGATGRAVRLTTEGEGHGIGLSVVRQLADANGLGLELLPRAEGQGTSIALTVPRELVLPAQPPVAAE